MTCSSCGAKRGHLSGCPAAKKPRKVEPQGGSGKTKSGTGGNKWIEKQEWVTCPTCNGSGTRGMRQCGLCKGNRKIKALK